MIKKRVLEFLVSVDIDHHDIYKNIMMVPSDIEIKQDEDCSAVFSEFVSKRIETIRKYSDEILFIKQHIDGDNSTVIIGSLTKHSDPKNPIGTIRIKGYKVECSDLIELVYTFSSDKIKEGKPRQVVYAIDPNIGDDVDSLIETSVKYKKDWHKTDLIHKCKCNVNIKEIENTPSKKIFNYIDDDGNVLDTLTIEIK